MTTDKQRTQRVGIVVSDKMQKTAVVKVERIVKHRRFKKYIKRAKKYYAHDETNIARIGDKVLIVATRPVSKLKRWLVSKVLVSAPQKASAEDLAK